MEKNKKPMTVDEFLDKKLEEIVKERTNLKQSSLSSDKRQPERRQVSKAGKTPVAKDRAEALGYAPGSRPWRLGLDLTGHAQKKLLARIATVTDQGLLAFVALNTNSTSVACAALKKITDQELLAAIISKKILTEEKCAAIEQLTDQNLLEQLAFTDTDYQCRQAAAKRLPFSAKQALLETAADFSAKQLVSTMVPLQEKLAAHVAQNRDLVKRLAEEYPCKHVQYLAWQALAPNAQFSSVGSYLSFRTPTTEIAHCGQLLNRASRIVDSFISSCNSHAATGGRSYSHTLGDCYDGDTLFSYREKEELIDAIKTMLRKRAFWGASCSCEDNGYGLYYVKIKASW